MEIIIRDKQITLPAPVLSDREDDRWILASRTVIHYHFSGLERI